jgi:ribosomal protein S18 acetylase RimI-like enzyme
VTVESSRQNPEAFAAAARRFRGDVDSQPFLQLVNARGFVALEHGEPVGWCWGYFLMRPDGAAMAYVHELEVAPEVRQQGIGRALFLAFMGAAKAAGVKKLFLFTGAENVAARTLYDSLGGSLAEQGPTVNYWFAL